MQITAYQLHISAVSFMELGEMDIKSLQIEFNKTWRLNKETSFKSAEFFDLDKYLEKENQRAAEQASTLMPVHVFLLENVACCFHLLTKFVGENKMSTQSAAFLSQLHRSVNCLITIRLLLYTGYEESCRPVTRSFFEALDISIACLVDSDFSEKLFGNERLEFDSLWKKEIGYGKIYKHLQTACELAGLPQDEINEHIKIRKAQKSILSASVHGDDSGAFRSMAPPVLGYPDMLSIEPHGVISIHTPNHAAAVIGEGYKYLSLVLKILISNNVPKGFNLPSEGSNIHSFFAYFITFQELIYKYDLYDGEEIIANENGH